MLRGMGVLIGRRARCLLPQAALLAGVFVALSLLDLWTGRHASLLVAPASVVLTWLGWARWPRRTVRIGLDHEFQQHP